MSDRRGLLIILSSPSGAGKSTLARKLRAWDTSLEFSVSATTRAPRVGEEDGKDYFFTAEDDFRAMVNDGDMLEHARVFNNYYGSPKGPVQKAIDSGRDVLFDVDWQGAQQVRHLMPDAVSVFIAPPSIAALRERLQKRGQDSEDIIERRMRDARNEMSHYGEYNYLIINDNFENTVEELRAIVIARRHRLSAQQVRHEDVLQELLNG